MDKNRPSQTVIPQAESLEKSGPSGKITLDQLEKEERRIKHVENDFDAFAYIRDIRFEKILFMAGMGLFVALTIIGFFFYTTVESREQLLSVASQVEYDFYAKLLKDKDYVFSYELDAGVFEYDPLLATNTALDKSAKVGRLASISAGGYKVRNGEFAQILDSSDAVVLELGDAAIHIDDLLLSPDGNSIIFDVLPSGEQAENKYGLRFGAYEYHFGQESFETLVSDASTGITSDDYLDHFVQVLSFSPNGRYLAYTNETQLYLYDRLSSASIIIDELDAVDQQPPTGWAERPGFVAEEAPALD